MAEFSPGNKRDHHVFQEARLVGMIIPAPQKSLRRNTARKFLFLIMPGSLPQGAPGFTWCGVHSSLLPEMAVCTPSSHWTSSTTRHNGNTIVSCRQFLFLHLDGLWINSKTRLTEQPEKELNSWRHPQVKPHPSLPFPDRRRTCHSLASQPKPSAQASQDSHPLSHMDGFRPPRPKGE